MNYTLKDHENKDVIIFLPEKEIEEYNRYSI